MIIPYTCIYHGGCSDGFGAAFAVWKRFGDMVFHYGVYGVDPPDVTGMNVIIVDFSYKRPVMIEMAKKAKSILVLDHHVTAEAELAGLEKECPNVSVVFDMKRSGAVIAWEYFFPINNIPLFFLYLQDRDLWTKQLPKVDEFTVALNSYPQDFKVWDELWTIPNTLINEGHAIQRYYRSLITETKKHAYMRWIDGHHVPVVNASLFMASDLAGELSEGYPFAAVYVESETHVTWSLRSRLDGIDVSEVAKKFGGGGHKNAAGFREIKGTDIR